MLLIFWYRRGPPPPCAGSRDRKWSYDRPDDVIGSPTSRFVSHRRISSSVLDYDNVFDKPDARTKPSTFVFDKEPVRQPWEDRPAAAVRRTPWQKNRIQSADNISVVRNPDKSITMSLGMPNNAESKENRMPVQQQQQQQQRHRNESFVMMSSPARVISPSPSRSLTPVSYTHLTLPTIYSV